MDITKIQQATEQIAEQLGIDLSAYGNASPTKLILKTLQAAVQIMQQTTAVAINELNPLTASSLRSRLGMAALVGLNPAQLLHASSGKVMVQPNGRTMTIQQHAKLISDSNISYYVVLPTDSLMIVADTELEVRQGSIVSKSYLPSGERWETFALDCDNYIDSDSIAVYADGKPLKIGFKLDEDADAYVRLSYDGKAELVLPNSHLYTHINVEYADCFGIAGDILDVDVYMTAKNFAYDHGEDVSDAAIIYVSSPIIGGTDFEALDADMANTILLSGHNNLIGTEAQLLEYANSFKQYSVQSIKLTDNVFALNAIRSIAWLCKTMTYWQACKSVKLSSADILALSSHMQNYASKSSDLLVNVANANVEQCRVNVAVRTTSSDNAGILAELVTWLIERSTANSYAIAPLYKQIMQISDVVECTVSFDGNVNTYGTAVPSKQGSLLLCTAATLTINGERQTYGDYDASTIANTDSIVKTVTTERIVDIA